MNNLILPPHLHQGDKIAIVSPSGKIDRLLLTGAVKRIKSWGLNPILSKHVSGSHGGYSGSIRQRVSDLQRALDDEDIKAILCSRGGYGSVHLLDKLDFTKFSNHPKWLIGFSDITALHNLFQLNGFASLHAPMARHLTVEAEDDFCVLAMKDILLGHFTSETAEAIETTEDGFRYICPSHKHNRKGTCSGILRGGNLAVFTGLIGTPYDIPPQGTILFIEDVGERPHAVERMLYNLKLSGALDNLSGLIIGQFTEYEENNSLGKDLYSAIKDLIKEYDYPVCFDFPVGHTTMNLPMINGAQATLSVESRKVKLNFNLNKQ